MLATDGSDRSFFLEITLENYLEQVYIFTRGNQPPVTVIHHSSKTSLVPQQVMVLKEYWVSELFKESAEADQSSLSLTFLVLSQMFMRALFNKLPVCKCLSLSQGIWMKWFRYIPVSTNMFPSYFLWICKLHWIFFSRYVGVCICTCVYTKCIVLHVESLLPWSTQICCHKTIFTHCSYLTFNVLLSLKYARRLPSTLNVIHLNISFQLISIWSNGIIFPLMKSINLLMIQVTDALVNTTRC